MKFSARLLTALLLTAAAASPALADGVLTPHQAEYKVRISVVSGKLSTELRRTDEGYMATHIVKATGMSRLLTSGSMNVSSTFANDHNSIKPVSYHAIDTIRDDPEARIRFDWGTNQAIGTVGQEDVVLQLDGLSHDAVSIQYQLMLDLINGRPSAQYTLFDVEKMRVANVTRVGEKTVETKVGQFDVVGIRHQKEGSSRTTTMWCAPELDYLPVVIEQHRKGKLNFKAVLTHYAPIST